MIVFDETATEFTPTACIKIAHARRGYEVLDTDVSGYIAGLDYSMMVSDLAPVRLPGCHASFAAAARRAQNVANALLSAGELGVRPWVGYAGARPHNMPRAGVLV